MVLGFSHAGNRFNHLLVGSAVRCKPFLCKYPIAFGQGNRMGRKAKICYAAAMRTGVSKLSNSEDARQPHFLSLLARGN
jgi:hypothetical protein